MKKNIRLVIELLFIFLLPLLLIIFNIEVVKEYDENNNEIEKKLVFNEELYQNYANNLQYKVIIDDFNKWDEETEPGIFDTTSGENINIGYDNTNIRTKSRFLVMAETEYYCTCDAVNSQAAIWAMFYDSSGNVIDLSGYTYSIPRVNNCLNIANHLFSTPANAASMKFYCNSSYGTTYNNDININISFNWANGNYVPYGEPFITYSNTDYLNQNDINYSWYSRIFNSLFSALNINNNIPLSIIVIYTLLWLVMWFIWHLLYLPLDFICSKLLFDRVDK